METIGQGHQNRLLTGHEIEAIVAQGLDRLSLTGQRVLVIVPDGTRTMPVPLFFRLITRHLTGKVKSLDFLVALGTHPALDEAGLLRLVGISAEEKSSQYRRVNLLNHAWDQPDALATVGTIPAAEAAVLTAGLLVGDVPIRLNRCILEYDHLLVCGPVFPHEIVGFSGGNKYFFPGIAGKEIIDFTHWLGALITNQVVIGKQANSVRSVIDRAAAVIPRPRHAFCAVVAPEGGQTDLHGLYFGAPEQAFSAAAGLSSQVHVRRVEKPYFRVLSVLPKMYGEVWTGAKGMYKLEPVVADGGEIILYAPHISDFSAVHGAILRQIGYHVRDYFVEQWDRYAHLPWSVLAHSTLLRGSGAYQAGIERPRIQVTLATSIPEADCRAVNLGYCDPAGLDSQTWADRENEGILYVPRAGEYLYRLV